MTSFMIIVVIALFIILMGFTWYRLDAFDGIGKIIICVVGILISWVITNTLFSISSNGMNYMNLEIKKKISEIIILVFTPINGIVFMPHLAKIVSDIKFRQIEKTEAIKKIVTLFIIIFAIFFIETKYLTNIQLGIFDVANSL